MALVAPVLAEGRYFSLVKTDYADPAVHELNHPGYVVSFFQFFMNRAEEARQYFSTRTFLWF